jgi:hypothetical protein
VIWLLLQDAREARPEPARSSADTTAFDDAGMTPHRDDFIERLLDLALEATFPASDPVSINSAASRAVD